MGSCRTHEAVGKGAENLREFRESGDEEEKVADVLDPRGDDAAFLANAEGDQGSELRVDSGRETHEGDKQQKGGDRFRLARRASEK